MKSITIPMQLTLIDIKHIKWIYHGASIKAFYNLLNNDYSLIQNIGGLNLIFIRNNIFLININFNTREGIFRKLF